MATTNAPSTRNNDFISSLPDSILHHILGFLMTEEAVRTCVLSKRWEHLWMSIPSLNFKLDDGRLGWFVKFVNAMVIRRKPLDLDVFRLSCHKLCSRYEVHERDWIRYAVNHNTRVLDLSLYGSVPRYIYTCKSLEELYLNYRNRYSSVQAVNLPNLRKLSISNSARQSYVKNLRSGCPILEFLRVDTCKFTDCVITDERLKYLAILKCEIQKEAQLFVSAPNLLSFSYEGELSLPCKTTLNMPSLSSACLKSYDSSKIKCFEGMTTCLRFLTHVELLELHFKFCRHKELLASDLSLELPIFPNLKNLTVAFCMFSCFQMVTWILKSSPNLEKLAILQKICYYNGEEGASTNELTSLSSKIAASPYKKLKIVEIKYYKYNQMVRQLVNTLMDGTKEFENLKIHLSCLELYKRKNLSF